MPDWAITVLTVLGSLISAYIGANTSVKVAIAKLEGRLDGIEMNIKALEKKQDKHNSVIERTYRLEQRMDDFMAPVRKGG